MRKNTRTSQSDYFQQTKEEMLDDIRREMRAYIKYTLQDLTLAKVARQLGDVINFPLTVHQVAQLTGRTEQNIYKMLQRCQIPYTKLGNVIHINLRDINNILIQVQN